jgi:hypothetical protein
VTAAARDRRTAYAPPEADIPLRGYAELIATFASVGTVALAAASRRGLPKRIGAGDLALLSVATHHAARLITKDKVTSVARAPFTEYERSGDPGEVEEHPRGHGVRKAIGELVSCPYCIGQWIALVGVTGLVLAPRTTRTIASVLAVSAGSDYLQVVHRAVSPE